MTILTCKRSLQFISLQIFTELNSPSDLPPLKAYPTPGGGGRFEIIFAKMRGKNTLKGTRSNNPHISEYRNFKIEMTKNISRPYKYQKYIIFSSVSLYLLAGNHIQSPPTLRLGLAPCIWHTCLRFHLKNYLAYLSWGFTKLSLLMADNIHWNNHFFIIMSVSAM